MSEEVKTKPVAVVEWLIGDRRMSNFLSSAGLGISSFGFKERTRIEYKPGEVVDEERVMKAVNFMIDELDKENSKIQISCPRLVSIHYEPV